MTAEPRTIMLIAVQEEVEATLARAALQRGWLPWRAESAEEAAWEIRRRHPSLIIVQITPFLSGGVDLIGGLRRAGRRLGIIAVGTRHNQEVEWSARHAGANYYFCSSIAETVLDSAIERLLGAAQGEFHAPKFLETG
jgi:DNA-binding response OmpR family regulator